MRIYFVTNRNKIVSQNNKISFGDKNSFPLGNIEFGSADFLNENKDDFTIQAYNYKKSVKNSGGTVVFNELYQIMSQNKDCDTLIYVHGFNYTFEQAILRAKNIKQYYKKGGKDLNIVLFTWGSDGSALKYASDREDAKNSALALSRSMQFFASYYKDIQNPCKNKVFLMAHSMGNYVLRNAVQSVFSSPKANSIIQTFDSVFLLAADEDRDTFEFDFKLKPMIKMSKKIAIFSYTNDLALAISDNLKGNPERLGTFGPSNMRLLDSKISHFILRSSMFERSKECKQDALNCHRYDIYCDDVRNTIIKIMNDHPFSHPYLQDKLSYEIS
jgi:esterase/lipase superfamily enzyme